VLSKPGGSATEIGGKEGTGAGVLVSDLRPRLEQVKALLDRVDVAAQQPAIMTYRVQHLGAESLATLAKQVVAKQEAAGGGKWRGELMASPAEDAVLVISTTPEPWLGLLQQLDQREEVVTRTYVVERFESTEVAELIKDAVSSSDDRWRLVNEELTGSLIITATPSDHAEVVKAMARLDAIEHVATPMKAFVIRHRPVADVLATLSSLVEQGVLEAPQQDDEARVAQSAEPRILREDGAKTSERSRVAEKAEGTSDSLSRMETAQLKMTADEATNTLLVSGNARQIDRLGELIGMIDVRQTQVMLDVMLVSMTDSDSTSLGVELERLGAIDNAATRLASLFGLSTSGAGGRTVGDGPGFTGAVLNPGEFSLVVRALQTLNKGNSLSNPKVLVTNNEQAVFSSTLQQPVQTQTRTGSNDTTFSYGGSESAGTTISVKPRIAQGDQLLLTYSIRLSSFVGTATTAGLPPPKQENSVDSIASIPDGHTVVVGGLEVRGESDGENRVPGLGAIPLLGNLFKNRSTAENRTRFYVFIRPNILRSQGFEDLRFLSERDAGMMGVEDGFPDVQPQVIR
jgi:general secretion pathway protein D